MVPHCRFAAQPQNLDGLRHRRMSKLHLVSQFPQKPLHTDTAKNLQKTYEKHLTAVAKCVIVGDTS